MLPALRSFTALTFAAAVVFGLLAPACSQQGEGERCDKLKEPDSSDCEAPLVCIKQSELLEMTADRCCPANAGEESDSRCTRRGSTSTAPPDNTSGSSSGGSSSGTGGVPSDAGGVPSDAGGVPAVPAAGGVPSDAGGMSSIPEPGAAGLSSSAGQGQGGI